MTDVRDLLGEIPALAAQLPQYLTGTTASERDNRGGGRGPARSRPPFDVALLDLANGREIENWTRLVYETMDEISWQQYADNPTERKNWLDQHPGPAGWNEGFNLATCCTWLAKHADWIREQFPAPKPVSLDRDHCALHCPEGHYLTTKRVRRHNGHLVCTWCDPGFDKSIEQLYWQYRRAARDLPPARMSCLECGNDAFIQGEWLVCTEVQDHSRTLKDIEHAYRYRPAMPASEIAEEFAVTVDQLRDWKRRNRLHAAGTAGRQNTYWPWDVFLLLNPTISEQLHRRDQPA